MNNKKTLINDDNTEMLMSAGRNETGSVLILSLKCDLLSNLPSFNN